jgi:hypothetical protein
MLAVAPRISNTEAGKSVEYHAGDFILEAIGHWLAPKTLATSQSDWW